MTGEIIWCKVSNVICHKELQNKVLNEKDTEQNKCRKNGAPNF